MKTKLKFDEKEIGEIIKLYNKGKLSMQKIEEKLNISSWFIKKILKENNIRIRNQGFYQKGIPKPEKQNEKNSLTHKKLWRDLNSVYHSNEFREKTNKSKIGKKKPLRTLEHRMNLSKSKLGAKNPSWEGGLSFEPYGVEFNRELKERIRKRDDYTCQECGLIQKQIKRKLSVHHIDYNKKNNNLLNLISLCGKCHLKTNNNRKHWKEYFKMKMFIRELFDPKNILIFGENKQLIGAQRIENEII